MQDMNRLKAETEKGEFDAQMFTLKASSESLITSPC